MDNNKLKNNFQGDIDNLWLKDHLNASFELDNIKMSQDLMDRTLKAIKEAEKEGKGQDEKDKVKNFPVRRLVSAAAVLLVLIAGIQVMQLGLIGNKKSSESKTDMNMMVAEEATRADVTMKYDTSEKSTESAGSMAMESEASYSNKEDTSAQYDLNVMEEASNEENTEAKMESFDVDDNTNSGGLKFSEICPVTADYVSAMSIAKKDTEVVVSQKPVEDTSKLYDILNEYPLNYIEEIADTENWIYKVTITSKENIEYTILVGEFIQVQGSNEMKMSTSGYSTEDRNALTEGLNQFYDEIIKMSNE